MVANDVWMIVAMARNRVIGAGGQLPWHLPADLKRFRDLTIHKPVIMGRRTYESIGGPLVHRDNIVLSRSGASWPGATTVASVDQALATARASELFGPGGVAVIGGENVYEQFLGIASRIEVTCIDRAPQGDARFPELPRSTWRCTADIVGSGEPSHRFMTLERVASRDPLEAPPHIFS
jgi:dihydrofolate reductase